ncbi:hypothetical protein ABTZ03_32515 [Kitasatospora sp. NPDC096077]|uniref:hypothetical protein n=1 Tax=Kitasatospora sp. NPDC096077 TaxID=3155544 RepID=UPI00331B2942
MVLSVFPDPQQVARILPTKQEAERKLVTMPGVTGIDIGFKQVAGEKTSQLAIVVFVRKKGQYRPEDEIPKSISGIPTDVVEATFKSLVDPKRYDPAVGGACIAPARLATGFGSLGLLVKDQQSQNPLWLSAFHVMCLDRSWQQYDKRILQPAPTYGGDPVRDTIGEVVRGIYGQVDIPWGYDLYVDAAVSTVSGRAASPNIDTVGGVLGAKNASIADLVNKYGAATEYRRGVIESTNTTVLIESQRLGSTWFYYQYSAEPPFMGDPALAESGDSGSPVRDSDGYLIGLVIAGSDQARRTTINPIGQIMEALKISL